MFEDLFYAIKQNKPLTHKPILEVNKRSFTAGAGCGLSPFICPHPCCLIVCFIPHYSTASYICICHQMMRYLILLLINFFLACCVLFV